MAGIQRRSEVSGGIRKRIWVITCDACGVANERNWKDLADTEIAIKNFRQQGWEISKHQNTCPTCRSKPKERPAMSTTTVQSVRDATPEEKSRIRRFLDGHFDDMRGCYLEGWSGKKAGEELKIPYAIIAKIREAAYGPIRVDPALLEMQEELARLQATCTELQSKITAFVKKLGGK